MPRGAAVVQLLVLGTIASSPGTAADTAGEELERRFTHSVRPFLAKYCLGCHSGASPAAQFNLQPYSTAADVVSDLPHWKLILDRLAAREMPPRQVPQPPADGRQEVIDWIQAVRMNEARRNDGDPGPVLLRRLNNSEYNNTIRDLTGVDIRPAREFPVDPANPAGFDNSGESLSMSPSLLNKYLQAAREVGDRMVLTPDGIDFASHPMLVETDRDKYAIQRIVSFYQSQPTDYAAYFQAAWRFKHRAALGRSRDTLVAVAAQSKLSPKYLPLIWQILEGSASAPKEEVGPIAKLQAMWRALPPPGRPESELRAKCVEMHDFVQRIRKHTAMEFVAPVVRGLSPTSQPLMNWKFRQFNSHRRDFDRKSLRMASDPPVALPPIPRYPGLGQESAFRAATLMAHARAGDSDLVVPDGQRERYEDSFARFSSVFPDAFYICERGRFFPDDSQDKGRLLSAGYHNVMGYWRDDTPLMELILDEQGQKQLNRLWDEFDFISGHTARTWVQYFFNQSGEVAGKGRESGSVRPSDKEVVASPIIFGLRDAYLAKARASGASPVAEDAIRYHFQWVNDTLRSVERMHQEAEPHHLDALLRFAARAYRKRLSQPERDELVAYYRAIREKDGLTHEEAIRDSIVRVLMSPKFCYRVDLLDGVPAERQTSSRKPVVSVASGGAIPIALQPLSGAALASRLSYFLWSSMPDDELMARAEAGDLHKPEVLIAQARRMLQDDRARALAVDFGGNWLDFRHFEEHNAVDRTRFPAFSNDLREAMFQEPVRFLEDIFRKDRSILDVLYANYTFVNPVLAKHYGMPPVEGGADHWIRMDDARAYGRGGLLAMSVFLTRNAPGLRTSPVKRGYWVVRRVLGEDVPPPPATVPELPDDEAKLDLPLRDMLAKHRENAACASCHSRFDSFGLALEGYGPIGEKRTQDLAGRPVDTHAVFPGDYTGNGFEGLQAYIREYRQKEYIDNFSRKLLAYALGRSLQLSDEPAVDRMRNLLATRGYRFTPLVEFIVTSPHFLNRRRPATQEARGE